MYNIQCILYIHTYIKKAEQFGFLYVPASLEEPFVSHSLILGFSNCLIYAQDINQMSQDIYKMPDTFIKCDQMSEDSRRRGPGEREIWTEIS